jgi:hypothetical protein
MGESCEGLDPHPPYGPLPQIPANFSGNLGEGWGGAGGGGGAKWDTIQEAKL